MHIVSVSGLCKSYPAFQLKDVSFRRLSALIANHQTEEEIEEERKSRYNNYTVEFI